MDEIVVLSGKGGTGKTSLTAAFAHLSGNAVFCDLDVDAPDLHLLLSPQILSTHFFISGNEAVIDPDRCSGCGLCAEMCRFGAVSGTMPYRVDTLKCEGCKLCVALCPESAIAFPEKHCGNWYRSKTRFGTMVHAQLFPAEENSGRLVALLRQEARRLAEAEGSPTILSDGPPGIGCPVISSLSGATLAVIVTEPTPSGIHDLKRILDLCTHFRVPAAVLVNKCDIDTGNTDTIVNFLSDRGIPVAGMFPYDVAVTDAMVQSKAITEFSNGECSRRIETAWATLLKQAARLKAA